MSEDKRNVETCVQDALAYTRLARSEAVPTPRKHSEVPLILFTLLISLSVGVAAIVLLLGAFGLAVEEDPAALAQTPALMCVVMVTVAMAASVAHLAKPLRAPTSLRNLASSWLSREIVLVSLFWGCLIIWCLAAFRGPAPLVLTANAAALALGIVLVFAAARAYRVHAQPLWDGSECAMELLAAALGAGVTWGIVSAGVLPAGVQFTVSALGLIGARLLYEKANANRARRLATPETPRERAALAQLEKLEGARKTILAILDAAIVVCLVFVALTLVFGFANTANPIFPASLATVAFYLARDRFYGMSVIIRPAVRRNLR
ncbi:MAG: dimethyl sulfoxide reductase anchor subunit [Eggerthellaceae bacterium]|nr:dimethyl sulfoxide reductase anchor subunit [Eggerthellaceae bacterium]